MSSMSLVERAATDLLGLLDRGEVTAEDVATAFLESIRTRDPKVRAFLHVDENAVLEQARALDAKRRAGKPLGPLAGIPIALKDLLSTAGQPTTCASKILQPYVPPYDAHVVTRLKAADAVFLGKTNMDEF